MTHAYEEKHHPIPPPDPIAAIEFALEQRGFDRRDLQRILGVGRGRVSERLSGKRGLSIRMIRTLSAELEIPAEILIQHSRHSV